MEAAGLRTPPNFSTVSEGDRSRSTSEMTFAADRDDALDGDKYDANPLSKPRPYPAGPQFLIPDLTFLITHDVLP